MQSNHSHDLPIRSKRIMAQDIADIIQCLHRGERSHADMLIEDLKLRAIDFEPKIQQDVLIFAETVQFQAVYDPWHQVTKEVTKAANRLLTDLGIKFYTETT